MGGVYNSRNLQTYHYANNNPIKYTDPSGESSYAKSWVYKLALLWSSIGVGPARDVIRIGTDINGKKYPMTELFYRDMVAFARNNIDIRRHVNYVEKVYVSGGYMLGMGGLYFDETNDRYGMVNAIQNDRASSNIHQKAISEINANLSRNIGEFGADTYGDLGNILGKVHVMYTIQELEPDPTTGRRRILVSIYTQDKWDFDPKSGDERREGDGEVLTAMGNNAQLPSMTIVIKTTMILEENENGQFTEPTT